MAICKMEFNPNSASICQVIQVGIQICADPQKVWIGLGLVSDVIFWQYPPKSDFAALRILRNFLRLENLWIHREIPFYKMTQITLHPDLCKRKDEFVFKIKPLFPFKNVKNCVLHWKRNLYRKWKKFSAKMWSRVGRNFGNFSAAILWEANETWYIVQNLNRRSFWNSQKVCQPNLLRCQKY